MSSSIIYDAAISPHFVNLREKFCCLMATQRFFSLFPLFFFPFPALFFVCIRCHGINSLYFFSTAEMRRVFIITFSSIFLLPGRHLQANGEEKRKGGSRKEEEEEISVVVRYQKEEIKDLFWSFNTGSDLVFGGKLFHLPLFISLSLSLSFSLFLSLFPLSFRDNMIASV